jgi:hypothetical protein
LPSQITAQVGYVATGGRNFPRLVDNIAYPTLLSDGTFFFPEGSVRRNPNFAEMRFKVYDATSSYHSLQVGVRRRFANWVGFQTSYVWSKTIDMASGIAGSGDIFNDTVFSPLPESPGFDKGRAPTDARHSFVQSFSVALPFGNDLPGIQRKLVTGWKAQGILTLRTGFPTAVTISFDRARLASSRESQRPNWNPGFTAESVVLGPPNKTKDPFGRYLDPSAFSLAAPGYLGNLGRNVFSGPGTATFDFSLLKDVSLAERANLEFRTEFFNLFNRPNFGYPEQTAFSSATQTAPSADFATITSTRTSARQIQFALKLTF